MAKKKLISFWGIGAQKAGTTWLYKNFSGLSELNLPPVKEMHYFDRDKRYPSNSNLTISNKYERLIDPIKLFIAIRSMGYRILMGNKANLIFHYRWHFSNYTDEWYRSLFDLYPGVTGEITPSYSILDKEDIKRMYSVSPSAKLVLMLRNPVKRAWSHFRFRSMKNPDFSFEKTSVKEIIAFMDSRSQVLRSDYQRTIDNYCSVFPKDQILIGFYDAIIDNPIQLLEEITSFIIGRPSSGIEKLDLNKRVHKSVPQKCPTEVDDYLKEKYHKMIEQLALQYGGYFSKWYEVNYGQSLNGASSVCMPTIHP